MDEINTRILQLRLAEQSILADPAAMDFFAAQVDGRWQQMSKSQRCRSLDAARDAVARALRGQPAEPWYCGLEECDMHCFTKNDKEMR